jgi:hypothetical protein
LKTFGGLPPNTTLIAVQQFSIRDLRIDVKTRYYWTVKAVFVELPPFERHREDYLDDEAFLRLQRSLMLNPEAGDVVPGTGGLPKLRFADERRGKGKRGGLRIIYYWWDAGSQFWLFTAFDKDEMSDLTATERKALKEMIKRELEARRRR